jgi:long-subunit acyl-CoA synthetase (AMP-forming)
MDRPLTLCELLGKSVESFHNPKMLNWEIEGKWKSFSSEHVYETVRCVALGIHSLGVNKNDKVAPINSAYVRRAVVDKLAEPDNYSR